MVILNIESVGYGEKTVHKRIRNTGVLRQHENPLTVSVSGSGT